jgi:hypothetical protein
MSASYRTLLPASEKPPTYKDIPIIRDALNALEYHHHEADVERAISLIFGHIFPQTEGWSNVPQYLVPERKRPDRLIEKYKETEGFEGSKENFHPHIFVELKSAKGDSLKKALEQATSSMVQTVDELGESFSIFLIITKGKYIAFFEYHNDRSNLDEDDVPNHKGAIPFNHVNSKHLEPQDLSRRPKYKGVDSLTVDTEGEGTEDRVMEGVYLNLLQDDTVVEKVLRWMKENNPVDVTSKRTSYDSAPYG